MSEPNKISRSEQSRINGSKSNGPTTLEGKAKSSKNSLKHGFAATINNVLDIEDKDAFLAHLAGIHASFSPQNYMEKTFVDQIASLTWRQARMVGTETALIDGQLSLIETSVIAIYPDGKDPYLQLAQGWRALATNPEKPTEPKDVHKAPKGYDILSIELLRRYRVSIDRELRNTLLNLSQYRKDFAQQAQKQEPAAVEPPPPQPSPEAPAQNEPRKPHLVPSPPPETTTEPKPQLVSQSPIRPINDRL